MEIFGVHLTNSELAQAIVMFLFLIIYSFVHSLKHQQAEDISLKYSVILCDFVLTYHPRIKSLKNLTKATDKILIDNKSDYYLFNE